MLNLNKKCDKRSSMKSEWIRMTIIESCGLPAPPPPSGGGEAGRNHSNFKKDSFKRFTQVSNAMQYE